MSQPPPAPKSASPLFRRLPANATPLQLAQAHADVVLFIMHTQPALLADMKATVDETKAIVAVADSVSQRAANTASGLELRSHELGQVQQALAREQHRLSLLVERLLSSVGRVEGLEEEMRSKNASIPDLAGAVGTTVEAVRRLAEEVDEITDHGQHQRPAVHDSERVRGTVKEVLDGAELEAWRDRRKWIGEVAKAAAGALAGAGLLEVARLIFLSHW